MHKKEKIVQPKNKERDISTKLTWWLPLMLWRPGIAAAISKHAFPSSCIERLCKEGWRVGAFDGEIEPTKLVIHSYQYSIYIHMITAATYTHTAILFCLLFAAHSTHMKLINSDITKDIMNDNTILKVLTSYFIFTCRATMSCSYMSVRVRRCRIKY